MEEPDGKLGSLPTEHALALHPAVEPLKGEPEGGKGQAGEEEVPPTAAEEELQEVLHRLRERLLLAELLLKLLRGDAELRGEMLLTRLPLLAEALETRRAQDRRIARSVDPGGRGPSGQDRAVPGRARSACAAG